MFKHHLCVLALLAACGGGGGGIAINDLPDALADAQCEQGVRCGTFPDLATCNAAEIFEGNDVETTLGAVAAGTIKYDEKNAAKCLDELASNDCTFPGFHDGDNSPCNNLFVGTVATGGACFISDECADQADCTPTDPNCDSETTCCPGTCGTGVTIAQEGGVCNDTATCGPNLYCKPGAAADGVCTALITNAGAACDDLTACADPMYCDFDFATGMFKTCALAADSGATCDPNVLIACGDQRDYCDPTSLKCTARAAAGAACADGGVECQGFATCTNNLCVPDPGLNAPCVVDGPSCLGTLSCVSGTCQAPTPGTSCI
jgi:hypothetical protein